MSKLPLLISLMSFSQLSYSMSLEDPDRYTFQKGKNQYMHDIGFDSNISTDTVLNKYPYFYNNPTVSIGIFDSGYYFDFDDLKNKLKKGTRTIDYHGTLIAGIIGAEKDNKIGYSGLVNPKRMYGMNLDDKETYSEKGSFIKSLCPHFDVINISLTISELSYRFKKDDYVESDHLKVMYWWRQIFTSSECKSTTFVLSAGNYKVDAKKMNGGIHYIKTAQTNVYKYVPATNVIVVGSIQGNEITQNFGESVDIYAPEFLGGPLRVDNGNSIYGINIVGTSVAAPQVTGAIALMHKEIRKNPERLKEFLVLKPNLTKIDKVKDKPERTISRPILNIYKSIEKVVEVYGPPI